MKTAWGKLNERAELVFSSSKNIPRKLIARLFYCNLYILIRDSRECPVEHSVTKTARDKALSSALSHIIKAIDDIHDSGVDLNIPDIIDWDGPLLMLTVDEEDSENSKDGLCSDYAAANATMPINHVLHDIALAIKNKINSEPLIKNPNASSSDIKYFCIKFLWHSSKDMQPRSAM